MPRLVADLGREGWVVFPKYVVVPSPSFTLMGEKIDGENFTVHPSVCWPEGGHGALPLLPGVFQETCKEVDR